MADGIPYIPDTITVHLGLPDSNAANVTLSFPEYVCNVASSELYPTWAPSALRANVLSIVSFALNRVFSAYYRGRGYEFDITSSAIYDMKFVYGRNYFDHTMQIVAELFNDYLWNACESAPLSSSFCNKTVSSCACVSRWGTQELACEGKNSIQILKEYCGDDMDTITNAPIQSCSAPYPGMPLLLGSKGKNVLYLQIVLSGIAVFYPEIPVLSPMDGEFGSAMEQSVSAFQRIFHLTVDGMIGKATWYRAVLLHDAMLQLSELNAQGQQFAGISWEYPGTIQMGNSGVKVTHLQYMLSVISEFTYCVPALQVTGGFDLSTKEAVSDFQKFSHLPATGVVDAKSWDAIYNRFAGIKNVVLSPTASYPAIACYPGRVLRRGMRD
ncbi:MAG: peptidoglycan-binding protein [Oscillospiraceae bacterium]|nr:peptidoglycan-binding protein [Oscillospiraceae bacterium]